MSKSLALIDTPMIGCTDCRLGENANCLLEDSVRCKITGIIAIEKEADTFPDWCPLFPIPEKREERTDVYNQCRNEGWNACIDWIKQGSRRNKD